MPVFDPIVSVCVDVTVSDVIVVVVVVVVVVAEVVVEGKIGSSVATTITETGPISRSSFFFVSAVKEVLIRTMSICFMNLSVHRERKCDQVEKKEKYSFWKCHDIFLLTYNGFLSDGAQQF